MTAPTVEDRVAIYGIAMGKQIKELKDILGNMKDMDIYKMFKEYIKTKKMDIKTLKYPLEHWNHVDKSYTTEDNSIGIFATENKFPCMDMYYTSNPKLLKEELKSFLKGYKTN